MNKRMIGSTRKQTSIWLGTLFIAASALLYLYSYVLKGRGDFIEFLLSFTVELAGIGLTFVFIDYIIQKAKDRDDLKSLSWEILHEVDYIVWVWLGGRRFFDLSELETLLNRATGHEKLSISTQNLILNLGNKAYEWRQTKRRYIMTNTDFSDALQELTTLATIRDNSVIKVENEVVKPLKKAIGSLKKIVSTSGFEKYSKTELDASLKEQERRHCGEIASHSDGSNRMRSFSES